MEAVTRVNVSVITAGGDYMDKMERYFCPQFTHPEKTYTYVNNSYIDRGLLMVADTTLSQSVHPVIYSTPSPWPRLQSLPVNSTSADPSTGEDYNTVAHLEDIFYHRVSVAVCVLGGVGNLLNLLVLSQKGLKRTLGRFRGLRLLWRVLISVSASILSTVMAWWTCSSQQAHASLSCWLWEGTLSRATLSVLGRWLVLGLLLLYYCLCYSWNTVTFSWSDNPPRTGPVIW